MYEKGSGCLGCLGFLVAITLIGSIFFGGGVLMRIGSMGISVGNAVDRNQITADYLNDLENRATVADKAVKTFHNQLNQGKCKEVYEQAHELLKSQTSLLNMLSLCKAIKIKFGSVESTEQVDWWERPIDWESSYILSRYETKLSKFTVQEIFIWLVKDGSSQLINYQIFFPQGAGSSSLNLTPSKKIEL